MMLKPLNLLLQQDLLLLLLRRFGRRVGRPRAVTQAGRSRHAPGQPDSVVHALDLEPLGLLLEHQ